MPTLDEQEFPAPLAGAFRLPPALDIKAPFRPHPLIRGGHAQTLAGIYLRSNLAVERAQLHRISLADGDQLALHDDTPTNWRAGGRTALLIHGLSGSHASGYMRRVAAKLVARGVRAFRLDLRGCGAGQGLAKLPYHAGCSADAAVAVECIAGLCPGSPVTVVGFSLGGNIALKLLGELGAAGRHGVDSGVAVCPPIDLAVCCRNIGRPGNRLYDHHFVESLTRGLAALRRKRPDAPGTRLARRPRSLEEFDDLYTAPVSGFGRVENYYRLASSKPLIASIRRPTLLVSAADDPLIPRAIFDNLPANDAVRLVIAPGGGHLGFVGRGGVDADRRWLDWRIVAWVCALDA